MWNFLDQTILASNKKLLGLWIAQNGKPLHIGHYQGHGPDSALQVYSASKSVAATLIGQALHLENLDPRTVLLRDLFPEYEILRQDERKSQLSVYHLLNQTSGLRWSETGRPWNATNSLWQMEQSTDWLGHFFAAPSVAEPGQQFNYNTGASHALGYVLERITGRDPRAFYREHLADPLGFIGDFWTSDPMGYPATGKGLHLRLEDLAKFGQCILDRGLCEGQQIVPSDWVDTMTSAHARGHQYYGTYGLQWWLRNEAAGPQVPQGQHNIACCIGFGGNFVFLIPAWEAIVVFQGHLVGPENFEFPQILLREHILPLLNPQRSSL